MTAPVTDRRTALRLSGLSIVGGLAGCLDAFGSDEVELGDLPAYHELITDTDDGILFAYVDFAAIEELEDTTGDAGLEDPFEENPFFGVSMWGLFAVFLGAGFRFQAAGIGDLIEEDAATFDSEVQELFVHNETVGALGSFETDDLEQAILAPPEDEVWGTEFESDEPIEGYRVYRSSGLGGDAIALSEDAVILVEGDTLEDAIATVAGDHTPAAAEHEDLEWLLRAAGDGMVALGMYDPPTVQDVEFDDDEDLAFLEDVTRLVSTATLSSDSITATLAMDAPSVSSGDLEAELGDAAGDIEYAFEGDRVRIEGSADLDDLE